MMSSNRLKGHTKGLKCSFVLPCNLLTLCQRYKIDTKIKPLIRKKQVYLCEPNALFIISSKTFNKGFITLFNVLM